MEQDGYPPDEDDAPSYQDQLGFLVDDHTALSRALDTAQQACTVPAHLPILRNEQVILRNFTKRLRALQGELEAGVEHQADPRVQLADPDAYHLHTPGDG